MKARRPVPTGWTGERRLRVYCPALLWLWVVPAIEPDCGTSKNFTVCLSFRPGRDCPEPLGSDIAMSNPTRSSTTPVGQRRERAWATPGKRGNQVEAMEPWQV